MANNESRYLHITTNISLLVYLHLISFPALSQYKHQQGLTQVGVFGTPHRSSTFAGWESMMANIAAISRNNPKEVFSAALRNSSEALMDLSIEFAPFAQRFSILNFFEGENTPLLGSNVRNL